jgi:glucokinase
VWGAVVVGLIHAYDPERAVIGGGVMRSAALIIPAIQDYVDKHAWTPWGTVRVAAAELGNNAGLLGAIPLLASELSS